MRVAKASIELATAPQFDFIIENNNLQIALDEAYDLVSTFVEANSEVG
jgi:guanylate kinase